LTLAGCAVVVVGVVLAGAELADLSLARRKIVSLSFFER
jgi:hypothetical protein